MRCSSSADSPTCSTKQFATPRASCTSPCSEIQRHLSGKLSNLANTGWFVGIFHGLQGPRLARKKKRYEIAKLPGHQNHDIQQTTSFQHLAPSCQAWLMNRSQSKPSGCCIKAQLTLPACSVTGLMYCSWLLLFTVTLNICKQITSFLQQIPLNCILHSPFQVWKGYDPTGLKILLPFLVRKENVFFPSPGFVHCVDAGPIGLILRMLCIIILQLNLATFKRLADLLPQERQVRVCDTPSLSFHQVTHRIIPNSKRQLYLKRFKTKKKIEKMQFHLENDNCWNCKSASVSWERIDAVHKLYWWQSLWPWLSEKKPRC